MRVVFATIAIASSFTTFSMAQSPTTITPSTLPRLGTVDERFQSYNIEMVEVTGGRFWKPYASATTSLPSAAHATDSNQLPGLSPNLFEFRQPIDLSNPRLRMLAAALGPAYLRVSGSWANTTFFQNTDEPAPAAPPAGFNGVLTRREWKGVVDFAHGANAELVTSFAISPGARDTAGVWTTSQAQLLLDYTHSIGGRIAAAEYFNEPNLPGPGGAPKGYDAGAYGRDVKLFRAFQLKAAPDMIFVGPGSTSESARTDQTMLPASIQMIPSTDLLTATGPVFDVFSYHSYGAVSSRCAAMTGAAAAPAPDPLSDKWLSVSKEIEAYYGGIRDRLLPGKPLWITETAEAACGGDRWASTFVDSFRYLNQLGLLAKLGVQVHMYNTLASSDYGLLDENTFAPRPNYWSALLWRRLMGATVLDPGPSPAPGVYLYAHCLRDHPGGAALLVINASRDHAQTLQLPVPSQRYTLTAESLEGTGVQLNGTALELEADDALPKMMGINTAAGSITFAPASITFLGVEKAQNAGCR
jgi:heparanase 1